MLGPPALCRQPDPVQSAPADVGPGRSVPQPADDHRDHEVGVGAPRAAPVASQREVDVVPQPAGKGYVPPPPELAQAGRGVRAVEVVREAEAEQQGDADGHVRIGGEVAVDLHAVAVDRDQYLQRRVLARGVEDRIDDLCGKQIRERGLLDQAADDQKGSSGDRHLARVARGGQLGDELTGPHDRPGHEMREEGLVNSEVDRLRRADVPTLDVNGV